MLLNVKLFIKCLDTTKNELHFTILLLFKKMVFVVGMLRGYEALTVWNVGEYEQTEAENIIKKLNEIVNKSEIRVEELEDKANDDEEWCFTALGCNTRLYLDIKNELSTIAPLACIPDYVDLSVVDLSLEYFISFTKQEEICSNLKDNL